LIDFQVAGARPAIGECFSVKNKFFINKKYPLLLIFIMSLILWWLFTPCVKSNEKDDFLFELWPPPNSEISLGCYTRRSVFALPLFAKSYPVTFTVSSILIADRGFNDASSDSNETFNPEKNIALYIDGQKVKIEAVGERDGSIIHFPNFAGAYTLGARYFVGIGSHTARVEVFSFTGRAHSFEWTFIVK
jgi:hypothetical protein